MRGWHLGRGSVLCKQADEVSIVNVWMKVLIGLLAQCNVIFFKLSMKRGDDPLIIWSREEREGGRLKWGGVGGGGGVEEIYRLPCVII